MSHEHIITESWNDELLEAVVQQCICSKVRLSMFVWDERPGHVAGWSRWKAYSSYKRLRIARMRGLHPQPLNSPSGW